MEFPMPELPDYYADLGVSQDASPRNIKSAWFKLAKRNHPDKKAPGKIIDAEEFRKVSFVGWSFELRRVG
jgi:curved DNA-binding protein CbpA